VRSADPGETGPLLRPQPRLAEIEGLVREARAAGQHVAFEPGYTLGCREPPRPQVQRTAFRIVQEGLTNARKHAPHVPVTVRLGGKSGAELEITVRNPLPPHLWAGGVPGAQAGLAGLAERVALDGGTLEHGPHDGAFLLAARIPWPR
jgi:signal transduction histidine kinase